MDSVAADVTLSSPSADALQKYKGTTSYLSVTMSAGVTGGTETIRLNVLQGQVSGSVSADLNGDSIFETTCSNSTNQYSCGNVSLSAGESREIAFRLTISLLSSTPFQVNFDTTNSSIPPSPNLDIQLSGMRFALFVLF